MADPFREALHVLDEHPPSFAPDPDRAEAFLRIGALLESVYREGDPHDLGREPGVVARAVNERLLRAARDLAASSGHTGSGVTLWQFYNAGVMVRSTGVTLGFDVIAGPRSLAWPDTRELVEALSESMDALFITHGHDDHCDHDLIRACLRKGKRVFLDARLAEPWKGESHVVPLEDRAAVTIAGACVKARTGCHVWRDDPDAVPCLYFEASLPAGYRMVFAGDADYTSALEATPGATVDLFLPTWRNPNARFEDGHPRQEGTTLDAFRILVERIKPRAILQQHYGELAHIREGFPASYDMALDLKNRLPIPSEVMFWGERAELSETKGGNDASRPG